MTFVFVSLFAKRDHENLTCNLVLGQFLCRAISSAVTVRFPRSYGNSNLLGVGQIIWILFFFLPRIVNAVPVSHLPSPNENRLFASDDGLFIRSLPEIKDDNSADANAFQVDGSMRSCSATLGDGI